MCCWQPCCLFFPLNAITELQYNCHVTLPESVKHDWIPHWRQWPLRAEWWDYNSGQRLWISLHWPHGFPDTYVLLIIPSTCDGSVWGMRGKDLWMRTARFLEINNIILFVFFLTDGLTACAWRWHCLPLTLAVSDSFYLMAFYLSDINGLPG